MATKKTAETKAKTATAAAPADQIHVTPRPDGKWQVKKISAPKASRITETQAEAIEFAKNQSKNEGIEYVVHGADGKIRKK